MGSCVQLERQNCKKSVGENQSTHQRAVQDPYLPLNAMRSNRVTSSVLSTIGNFTDRRVLSCRRKGGAPTRWPEKDARENEEKVGDRATAQLHIETKWKEVLTIYLALR